MTTTAAAGGVGVILTADEIAELIVTPVTAAAVATLTSTAITTSSSLWRLPIVADDPTAAWVAEGAEISPSDAELDEIVVTPAKLAGLTIITRELAEDTSPEAQQLVGEGLARDIARKLDAAYLGNLATPAPPGLGSLTPTLVDAGAAYADLDPFAEAISRAEELGAALTSWITSPATALDLARIKVSDGSREPLITSPEAGSATSRAVSGLPMFVSPAVAPGVVWGIPQDRVFTVIRDDTRVDVDASVFFTSDRVAVRATMRVGFGFPQPAAIVKISTTTAP